MAQGHDLWEEFCKEELGNHQEPSDPGSLYNTIRECNDATTLPKALDISRRFSADPTAKREEKHPHVLHELADRGYSGGELLRILQAMGMALMKDKAFDRLVNRDESGPVLSRNAFQHLIHQNTELAVQVSMLGYIVQEVGPDVIGQCCEAVSYMLLEIKLLYQQRRIRRYRFEPYRPIQNNRKGRPRVEEGSPSQGEALWKKWHKEGLGLPAADENDYLNHWLETPEDIRENLLNRMNRCSVLAVRLHSIISQINLSEPKQEAQVGQCGGRRVIKQTSSVKEDTLFFENAIGIKP